MSVDPKLAQAYAAVVAQADFLRRVHVRCFAAPGRGLVVDLCDGTLDQWKAFWNALEAAKAMEPPPPKKVIPREKLRGLRWRVRLK